MGVWSGEDQKTNIIKTHVFFVFFSSSSYLRLQFFVNYSTPYGEKIEIFAIKRSTHMPFP